MHRQLKAILITALLFYSAKSAFSADSLIHPVTYIGMCDASAAVSLDCQSFIVANDEDNILRIYRNDKPGEALEILDLTPHLQLVFDDKSPEGDIEGATRIGQTIYWITSHGRNKDGWIRPNRYGLFVTRIVTDAAGRITVGFTGTVYKNLIQDLTQDKQMHGLGIDRASLLQVPRNKKLAPKKKGINIEGLGATPDGRSLLIAFRNPRPQDKALIVVLENPDSVIFKKARPRFAEPILLDLHGLGIRSIEFSNHLSAYLIVAGSNRPQKRFELFKWSGKADEPPVLLKETEVLTKIQNFTPEALIVYPNKNRFQVLSDDGDIEIVTSASESKTKKPKKKACRCKDLRDPKMQTFRSLWITPNSW